ncbi:arsenic transporter [Mucilaginibacter sp. Bleaf8]|uniref:arsenic transporter n=1 Tax=Mucilaginibacter sp. Bleaf8 TaxID=2834430 RepID=UPI001BCE4DFB|nr:arsenic transporter [Mucilaginibacter sp. Bleaf8]MBS7563895.1 arsenic transporter [Mucilaginibacter sp. Bleaf8]
MTHLLIWIIAFFAIAGVIVRPFKVPEAVLAVAGALLLVLARLILPADAVAGIIKGTDVYLFLTGMMILAEVAREQKLFDWLAAYATKMANGSSTRLFVLIYIVGIVVTALLSNDATAVVLTPAVAAAMRAAKVQKPLPYLFICAFIANAASFVLPISNPANLVIYGSHLPSLWQWLQLYALPAVVSIAATYIVLFFCQRKELRQPIESGIVIPKLSGGGKAALGGVVFTALGLMICSVLNIPLGLPAALTGILTYGVVVLSTRSKPLSIVKNISWGVLPLVAGLFVIVEALNKTGLTTWLTQLLHQQFNRSPAGAVWLSGVVTALGCNLMNNLPAGLIAGNVVQAGHVSEAVKGAVLVGIDLGPNLSVTGSLATILWLVALRREGQSCSAGTFLKLGVWVMGIPLLLTIVVLWLINA